MRMSDWSSDVCSSDLPHGGGARDGGGRGNHLGPGISIACKDFWVGCAHQSGRISNPCPCEQPRHIEHPAERRSEEHTSELQSLMRISYAVFCLKKKTINKNHTKTTTPTTQYNN